MRQNMPGGAGFELPPLHPWMRNLLIGLFALYVVELIIGALLGQPLFLYLGWRGFGEGFAAHQLLTRYLVQGTEPFGPLISLLVLYFFLPALDRLLTRSQLLQALAAVAVGGTAFGLLLNAIGLVGGFSIGWSPAILAGIAVFGLAMPQADVRLFFLVPIKGVYFAWGSGIIAALLLLAALGGQSPMALGAADGFGAWLGVVGWWFFLGPGARRRRLMQQSQDIQRELRRFQVLPGGRDDDDTVH